MRLNKFIYIFLALATMVACVEDDEGLILSENDITVPQNISANFDISNDNTGTVKVLPTADGASAFEITFGDEDNEEPTVIVSGESVEHVYAEGDFVLTITAISVTGGTASITQDIVIQFDPPENLSVDIAINRLEVTVTPVADGAASFDVFFGDEENEEPTMVMVGAAAINNYAEPGEYIIRTIARGAGAAFIERSDTITVVNPVEAFPLDFETDNQEFGTFNGATFSIITDPDDADNRVGQMVNSGNEFEGGSLSYETAVDFSINKVINMRFFTENPDNVILMKFENGTENAVEVAQTATNIGWNDLSFDFSNANFSFPESGAVDATGAYNTITLFIDGPDFAPGTYLIDDIAIAPPSMPLALPLDFSDPRQTFGTFNGATFSIEDGPVDMTNRAGQLVNAGVAFEGISLTLDEAIDLSVSQIITLRFFTETPNNDILLKLEAGTELAVEVAQTVTSSGWNDVTFDFSNANLSFPESGMVDAMGAYNAITLFVDGPATTAGTYFFDDITQAGTGMDPLGLPLDFSSADQTFGTFNGASFALEMDPFDGTNQVGNIINSGAEFEGAALSLATPVDFSQDKVIRMRFFTLSPNNAVLLKLENGDADPVEVVEIATDFGWNDLSFDFSEANFSFPNSGAVDASGSYSDIVIFVDGPESRPGSYLIDDIRQTGIGLPLDFNSQRQAFGTFNGASFEIVANPEDADDPVGQITNVGVDFEGTSLTLEDAVDFSSGGKVITMNFYTDVAGTPVVMKFENGTELAVELSATADQVGWNELSFDFSAANLSFPESGVVDAVGQYLNVVIFVDIGETIAGTHFIDDIKQVN